MKPSLDTVFSVSMCFYNLKVCFEYFKLFFYVQQMWRPSAIAKLKTVDKKTTGRKKLPEKIRMTFRKFVSEDNNEAPD